MDIYNTGLTGIVKISDSDFAALTVKDSATVYYVVGSDFVTVYLGAIPVDGGLPLVELTQAQYDAMQTHDSNTLYAIPEATV